VAAVLDRALALGSRTSADRSAGQLGLFGAQAAEEAPADYPDVPEWPDAELLKNEREAIGYYATDHPLAEHERLLRLLAGCTTESLGTLKDRTRVRLGGMIREPRTTIVKSGRNEGRRMGFFLLEDFHGTVEAVLFARTFADIGHLMGSDRIILLEGKLDMSREEPSVHVDRIVPIEDAPRLLAEGVVVRLDRVERDVLADLKSALGRSAGPLPVVLEFEAEPDTIARVKAGPAWSVEPTEDLLDRLAGVPAVASAEFLARAP
jgi:DNA polymerase-3 subunit alpha